jgi:ATP-dependent DNA helicase RecQ
VLKNPKFSASQALEVIKGALGSDAQFHEHQWEAIDACVNDIGSTLVVQRTGWGKSAVYFAATRLLRSAGAGPTLVISPLLALMRNQTLRATSWGLAARTVNSDNNKETKDGRRPWDEIRLEVSEDKIDMLIISPERLHAKPFVEEFLPSISSRCQLVVVDEAHCISDWGHDFRPEYRMIRRAMTGMSGRVRLLCTTATANDRVIKDIESAFDGRVRTIRGTLDRPGLRLDVVALPSAAHRLGWIAEAILGGALPGSGIVYTLTRRDAHRVDRWLRSRGIASACYVGGSSDDERRASKEEIEEGLLANQLRVVVATQALGMGFDKPDLAWIVHYQQPGSAVLWYQQVGRAGRGLSGSIGVVLKAREDRRINEFFAKGSFPSEAEAVRILRGLESLGGTASDAQIADVSNIKERRIGTMLKLLASLDAAPVEGVGRIGRSCKWRLTANPLRYPHEVVERCASVRLGELDAMDALMSADDCIMMQLRRQLNDGGASPCGRCSRCVGTEVVKVRIGDSMLLAASRFDRYSPSLIRPRKKWALSKQDLAVLDAPLAAACTIPEKQVAEPGRYLCDWALDEIGRSLAETDQLGRAEFPAATVAAMLEFLCAKSDWPALEACRWIALVPSRKRQSAMNGLGRSIAGALRIPLIQGVISRQEGVEDGQQSMNSQLLRARHALASFRVDPALVRPDPVLLVDDCVDSGWTFTVIAALLREAGSGPVFPLALASTRGSGGGADGGDDGDE